MINLNIYTIFLLVVYLLRLVCSLLSLSLSHSLSFSLSLSLYLSLCLSSINRVIMIEMVLVSVTFNFRRQAYPPSFSISSLSSIFHSNGGTLNHFSLFIQLKRYFIYFSPNFYIFLFLPVFLFFFSPKKLFKLPALRDRISRYKTFNFQHSKYWFLGFIFSFNFRWSSLSFLWPSSLNH